MWPMDGNSNSDKISIPKLSLFFILSLLHYFLHWQVGTRSFLSVILTLPRPPRKRSGSVWKGNPLQDLKFRWIPLGLISVSNSRLMSVGRSSKNRGIMHARLRTLFIQRHSEMEGFHLGRAGRVNNQPPEPPTNPLQSPPEILDSYPSCGSTFRLISNFRSTPFEDLRHH